jgi:hypothetical protein
MIDQYYIKNPILDLPLTYSGTATIYSDVYTDKKIVASTIIEFPDV